MVRRLFKSGNSVVLALSKEMLDALHLQAGEGVTVELDAERRQIVVSRIPSETGDVDEQFACQVAEFIDAYRPALEALR